MPEYQNHGERNLVINHRVINYTGIFQVNELFESINSALIEKGYSLRDKRNEEVVSEAGKNYYLELRPFKDKTNYVTLLIKIVIRLRNVTRVVQEVDGHQISFDMGEMEIVFDSWSYTDYESRWGMRPFMYFMKGLVQQWFYQMPMESGFTGELKADTAFVFGEIKKLLSSYRKRDMKYVSEEDVRSEIEKDIMVAGETV